MENTKQMLIGSLKASDSRIEKLKTDSLWTRIKQFRFPVDFEYLNELKKQQKILDTIKICDLWITSTQTK
jgi:hypothetical protein